MSVFISWRGADRSIKNQMVEKLRGLLPQEEIWESDEGCKSNSFVFMEQLRKSEVFIVIVSDAAMQPSYVLNEVVEARRCEMEGTLNMLVYKVTDAPYTPEFAANLNHLSDSNYLARLSGRDDGIDLLARRVQELLEKRRNGEPENPYETFVPEVVGTSLSAGYFVPHSRDDIFEAIDEAFARSNILFVTQLSGFGRKSAAREYALERQGEYSKVVVLHYFSGSLREFFTKGVQFANVNRELFENLEEKDLILKKSRMLERLGPDVLLIVPEVTPGDRDDRFVFDCLAKLGCRVIFVTQSDPRRIRDIFPVISVDRMEDRYLKELFFNYYHASADEQQELDEVLSTFFDNIDGHTKSVEITANALSEEFGIYPEDLPGILGSICGARENELSERIFSLISGLFDVTSFGRIQQNILLVAAYFAGIPIDEKLFVSLLKESGCYDGTALHMLIDRRWLDNDRNARTISMETFMADVLRHKLPVDQKLLGKCLRVLYDRLVDGALGEKIGVFLLDIKRVGRFAGAIKAHDLAQLVELYEDLGEGLAISHTMEDVAQLRDRALSFNQGLTDGNLSSMMNELATLAYQMSTQYMLLNEPTFRQSAPRDLSVKFASVVLNEETIQLATQAIPHGRLRKAIADFLTGAAALDFSALISKFVLCVDLLCAPENVKQVDDSVSFVFNALGRNLATATGDHPYLCLQICRAWKKINDTYGYLSESNIFNVWYCYFRQLHYCRAYNAEFQDLYEGLCDLFPQVQNELFTDSDSARLILVNLHYYWFCYLLNEKDLDGAQQPCQAIAAIKGYDSRYSRLAGMVEELVNAYIKIGKTEEAKHFLGGALDWIPPAKLEEEGDRLTYEGLTDTYNALKNPVVNQTFVDRAEDYIDYYQTYAPSFVDRKLLYRYGEIARQAKEQDYAAYSDGELRETAELLKMQARQGTAMLTLAPEAFALVSEAGQRVLGYRHHYVQYLGGAAIADGNIAEIQNGEGKTYTILLAAFLHSLFGKQVHIIDTSEYLTVRNYHWMRGVLELLGCEVALLEPLETSRNQDCSRADVVYTTAKDIIFMCTRLELDHRKAPLRTEVAIIDEAEQFMVAQGYEDFTLVGNTVDNNKDLLLKVQQVVDTLTLRHEGEYYTYSAATKNIKLNSALYGLLEQQTGLSVRELEPEDLSFLERALVSGILAKLYLEKDKDYFVTDGRICEENALKGTFDPIKGVKLYFLSLREGLDFDFDQLDEREIQNRYCVLEYLKQYEFLTGTTATASSMEKELREHYDLNVIPVPPNEPTRRVNHPTGIFFNGIQKRHHIVELVAQKHGTGQPVLVITDSVFASVQLSNALKQAEIPHNLLNATNIDQGAALLERAGHFGAVTVTTALANRGVDIRLGGNPVSMAKEHLLEAGYSATEIREAPTAPANQPLRVTYDQLLSLYQHRAEKDRKALNELGGLCVIGTACFDDLRIEQQMRGRCGRQGDRGEAYVFISMDDPGMKRLLDARFDTVFNMVRSNGLGNEMFQNEFLNKSIALARQRYQSRYGQWLKGILAMYYRPKARAQFAALKQQLMESPTAGQDLLDQYFAHSSRCGKDALAKARGEEVHNFGVQTVYPYIEKELAHARNRDLPALLMKGYDLYRAENEEQVPDSRILTELIRFELCNQWRKYLSAMDEECARARNIYDSTGRKLEHHLKDFSQKLCTTLVEDAVGLALSARRE
ncbi:MAG: hypothetical protein IJD09_00290 [Clostridia bacterium]|nr:hypothetical protein [Clostridia bacterium]